jgi:hypothetical protein
MGLLNVLLVLTTLHFLMSMHAYICNACRILHGEEQKLMSKSLLLGSLRGYVPPPGPNSGTHIPASTLEQKDFAGQNFAPLMGSLQRGSVPPSVPNPGTHIPASKFGQKAFVGHSMIHSLSSLKKGPVPPSAPNSDTHIPTSMFGQKAFTNHNIAHLLSSLQKGKVPPSYVPNPTIP